MVGRLLEIWQLLRFYLSLGTYSYENISSMTEGQMSVSFEAVKDIWTSNPNASFDTVICARGKSRTCFHFIQ